MQTIQLEIDGMTCEMCVAHVTKALQNVPHVREVQVELQPQGRAIVMHDSADMSALISALIEAVREEGYDAAAL